MIQLILSRPLAPSEVTKISVRPITIQNQFHYQWSFQRGAQAFHDNVTADQLIDRITAAFATKYGDLHWFATEADVTVRVKPSGQVQFKTKPPTKSPDSTEHNRTRQRILPEGQACPFLETIGVMSAQGKVFPTMAHKFRQINRYLEFVDDIYEELPATGEIRVVDFGCGKSYLTFAVHHYLTVNKSRDVHIVGIDLKREVIQQCQSIARDLRLTGLEFITGDIQHYSPAGSVHLAISLHACDTATDEALAHALAWQSDVIFAVPCCQHELSRLLPETVLPGMVGYGLLRERFAADVTDALRARFLEMQGYRTQIVEFIELEHTPKNLLIRAVRRRDHSAELLSERRRDYERLKAESGITGWHLERAVAALTTKASSSPHGN